MCFVGVRVSGTCWSSGYGQVDIELETPGQAECNEARDSDPVSLLLFHTVAAKRENSMS